MLCLELVVTVGIELTTVAVVVSVVYINPEYQIGALRLLKRLANRILNIMYMLSFTNPH